MTSADLIAQRARNALLGMAIGDSLSMPVHWYYRPSDIQRDFGKITNFHAPKERHPSSIMAVSNTGGAGRGSSQADIVGKVILHGKKKFWGQSSAIHYHQGMQAGENTLNLLTSRVLVRRLVKDGAYNPDAFLHDYISFMTTPGSHNDTYAESFHRMFFVNLQNGKQPRHCADDDGHNIASMGGFVNLPPVSIFAAAENAPFPSCIVPAKQATKQQTLLTHNSAALVKNAEIYSELLTSVLYDKPLREAVQDAGLKLGLDIASLSQSSAADTQVIGSRFSSACYITDSFPSLLFLAHRYADCPEEALIANTNVGGENCHRGAALGALMGVSMKHGESWPDRWVNGLHDQAVVKEAHEFAELVKSAYIKAANRL